MDVFFFSFSLGDVYRRGRQVLLSWAGLGVRPPPRSWDYLQGSKTRKVSWWESEPKCKYELLGCFCSLSCWEVKRCQRLCLPSCRWASTRETLTSRSKVFLVYPFSIRPSTSTLFQRDVASVCLACSLGNDLSAGFGSRCRWLQKQPSPFAAFILAFPLANFSKHVPNGLWHRSVLLSSSFQVNEHLWKVVRHDHRITEWSGLEGTSVGHLVQPSCQSRVTYSRL